MMLTRAIRSCLFSATKRKQFLIRSDHTIEASEMDLPAISRIESKLGFIGDGNMAKAICNGLVNKGLISYQQVIVSSPYVKNLDAWKALGATVTIKNNDVLQEADTIVLAVKPHILEQAISTLDSSSARVKDKLFVSILAGIKLAALEKMLDKFSSSRVIRVMPNTPVTIGEGCSVYTPGKNVSKADILLVRYMFETSGFAQMVPENLINAVGALSGSGPAFVYLLIEALSDGGVRMGIHRDMATKFAAKTVLGAAKMVLESGRHTGQLKDQVCSAGGTTIAGMHALERGGVRGAVMNAVEAAALKADEISK